MRIGFFTDTYLPQINGVVTAINDIGRELVRRGHTVYVFAPGRESFTLDGIRVHCYPSVPFLTYPGYRIAFPHGKVPSLDVVHAHTPFSLGYFAKHISKKHSLPLVGTYHTLLPFYTHYLFPFGMWFRSALIRLGVFKAGGEMEKFNSERENFPYKLAVAFTRWHYSGYDAVIVPSYVIAEMFRNWTSMEAHVIPTGIDLKRFHPVDKEEARSRLGLEVKGRMYLYLGRISLEKRIEVLLEGAQEFLKPGDLFAVVGRGPWVKELEALIKRTDFSGEVKYFGEARDQDLPFWYSAADLFLTASESETQGLVLLESMACGTPVVAADALATSEVIRDSVNGYLFPPHNPEELSRVILERDVREEMKKECLKTAKEFSIESCVSRLEALYRELSA